MKSSKKMLHKSHIIDEFKSPKDINVKRDSDKKIFLT